MVFQEHKMKAMFVFLCAAAVICQEPPKVEGRETKDPEVRLREIVQLAQNELAKVSGYTAKIEANGSNTYPDFYNVEEAGELKVNLKERKCLMTTQTMKVEQIFDPEKQTVETRKTPVANTTVYYDGVAILILDNMTRQGVKYTIEKPAKLKKFAPAMVCTDLLGGMVPQIFSIVNVIDAQAQRNCNESENIHLSAKEREIQKDPDSIESEIIQEIRDPETGEVRQVKVKVSGRDLDKQIMKTQRDAVDINRLKGGEVVYYWGFELNPKIAPPSQIKVKNVMLDLAEKTFLPMRLQFDMLFDDGQFIGNRIINFKEVKAEDVIVSEPDLSSFTITTVEAK